MLVLKLSFAKGTRARLTKSQLVFMNASEDWNVDDFVLNKIKKNPNNLLHAPEAITNDKGVVLRLTTIELANGQRVVYFGSGCMAPACCLSNFARCPIPFLWKGLLWNSSEAAYCCWRRLERKDWDHFAVGGKLCELESGIPLIFPQKDWDKKQKHYGAKTTGKPDMVGILPKMAMKRDVAKKLGLELKDYDHETDSDQLLIDTFVEILMCKYLANPKWMDVLLATEGKQLVEFDRGAGRETLAGRPPRWTGIVKGGVVLGGNLQGRIQEIVRAKLQN